MHMSISVPSLCLFSFLSMSAVAQVPSDPGAMEQMLHRQQRQLEALERRQAKSAKEWRTAVYELRQQLRDEQARRDSAEKSLHAALNQGRTDTERYRSESREWQSDTTIKLSQRTLWVAGIVGALVLIVTGGFVWLRRRIGREAEGIDAVRRAQDGLQAAQRQLQEESVKMDDKLLALLEGQMATARTAHVTNSVDNAVATDAAGHDFVLKVADEITRIEMNLAHMDQSIKGYKQLKRSLERMKTNFMANGYEVVEMLGHAYHEGLKATVDFIDDETLEKGIRVITRITKPQINFEGRMIQAAQITVSQNI